MRPRLAILRALLHAALLGAALLASPAAAQSVRTFTNSTSAAINSNTPCTSPIVRSFTVTSNFLVGDVDLGVLATHAWRGDIRITLQSPAGTRQQLVNGDEATVGGDNFSVRLNDGGTQVVNTDDPLANHSSAAVPPYQHNFRPNAPLSVFNGQASAGTWRLEICDIWPGEDNGTFVRSDLYLTPATSSSGTGAIFVVSSTADSGTATLRQAVIDANATTAEADSITFAIAGAGPHTITLASALPNLTDNGLVIDGATQSGSQCRSLWDGNGHALRINLRGSTGFDGLRLGGAGQTVRGLSISGFSDGIELLAGSSNATIQCSYIGLLADGASNANAGRGVNVLGAGARIGGLASGEGNVISASATGVLTNAGSTDTAIRGNFIGTDPAGLAARANGTAINNWSGSATWRDITGNLISGNTGTAAIAVDADDQVRPSNGQIRIQGNRIGANRTLTALLRNGGDGIGFAPGSVADVLIGGTASSEGNFITASDDGIDARSVTGLTIRGNTIAISGARGIVLDNVNGAAIGGTGAGQGNSIGGNGSDGIHLRNGSTGITVLANLIQPIATIGGTFDNAGHGIVLDGVSAITIGDGTAAGRNVIGGNRRRGIFGLGVASGITINGNYIGTDATGNVAVANGQNEGAVTKDAISFDSGGTVTTLAILNNVIGGYGAALVELWNSTTNGVTIQGNRIGVGANGTAQIVSGNTEDLIYVGGGTAHSNLLIGGSGAGQGNVLAFSGRSGIRLESTGSTIQVIGNTIRNNARNGIYLVGNTRAAILANRIHANTLIGIDLGENGVTLNDAGDGDAGANDLLNFPVIGSANTNGTTQLTYAFTLDAPAAANGYRIDFFANAAAHSSGHGEGERFIGSVDIAHAGGSRSFSGVLNTLEPVAVNTPVTATASRRTASGWDITSEFSAVATASGMAQLAVAMATTPLLPAPPAGGFATPGNDMVVSTTVSNVGTGPTHADSIFVVVSIDADNSFLNAASPEFGGVIGFASAAPSLTFTPGTDLGFSNAASPPASFSQCTYAPAAGADPQVRHLCLNPKGTLPPGTPQGQFTVQLRTRIR